MATAKKKPLKLEGTAPKTVDPVEAKNDKELTGVSPEYAQSIYADLGSDEKKETSTKESKDSGSGAQTAPKAPSAGENK